jgi:hypothetical protein
VRFSGVIFARRETTNTRRWLPAVHGSDERGPAGHRAGLRPFTNEQLVGDALERMMNL